MKEDEIKKIYWSIGEVADALKTSTTKIRYWSNDFKIAVSRHKGDKRRFDVVSLKWIVYVYYLIHQEGFTHRGVHTKLEQARKEGIPSATIELLLLRFGQ